MMLAAYLKADTPMGAYSHVTTSPDGRCYFLMIAPQTGKEANGVAYQVARDGSNEELWRTDGWYSSMVFLSEEGSYLVRLNPSVLGHKPSPNDLAVAFYKNGSLLKKYSTADLVKDGKKVVATVSYYRWMAADVEKENQLVNGGKAPGSDLEPKLLWWEKTFRLKTCDNISYVFDITTGDIRSSSGD